MQATFWGWVLLLNGFVSLGVVQLEGATSPSAGTWDNQLGHVTYQGGGYSGVTTYRGTVYGNNYFWTGSTLALWNTNQVDFLDCTAHGDVLYAAGRGPFSNGLGLYLDAVFTWNGTNWSRPGSGIQNGLYDAVATLASVGTNLYAGGYFTLLEGGHSVKRSLARWDGHEWSGMEVWDDKTIEEPGFVYEMATHGEDLYIVGSFNQVGELNAQSLAKWDGTNWSSWPSLGWPTVSSFTAIAIQETNLYLASGDSVGKWDGVRWTEIGHFDGPQSVQFRIWSLAIAGSDLYAGGSFTNVNGIPANNIARWDGTNWSALGTGITGAPYSNPTAVHKILPYGDDLFVAGYFTRAGGNASTNIAIWHRATAPSLEVRYTNGVMHLSWPAWESNYLLETSADLSVNGWSAVSPAAVNNAYDVTPMESKRFYRLRRLP